MKKRLHKERISLPALEKRRFLLVTNREPYSHNRDGDEIVCAIPVGGVTAALDPVMQHLRGVWIAWGSGSADAEVVDDSDVVEVPPDDPQYYLRRVWLTPAEVENFYLGYSNRSLWPLCHQNFARLRFEKKFWDFYRRVNRKFASAAVESAGDEKAPIIWMHDYHLTLVPRMIHEKLPGASLLFFWHIPWPDHETFHICPQRTQILKSLLQCRLLGFHTTRFCRHFLECVEAELKANVDHENFTVDYRGNRTWVKPFPISIDFQAIEQKAARTRTLKTAERIRRKYPLMAPKIGFGIDRMDYTKGIPNKLEAYKLFFEKYPAFLGKVTFVQVCSPSRQKIPAYIELKRRADQLAKELIEAFQTDRWTPLVYITHKISDDMLLAFYRMADVCVVASLQDGMNLVAKEFVASQTEEKGLLLLSQFAGASEFIEDALPINPYDLDHFADTLHRAFTMPKKERAESARKIRRKIARYTIYDWIESFFEEAGKII
ncbi:MAG: trehalose-6-phosphate synthase [bacterium]